jgi:hypothetical protein
VVSELALLSSGRTLHRWDPAAGGYTVASRVAGAAGALRQVPGLPWQGVEQGRRLAAAELKRLGLRPPLGWADTAGGAELDRG